MSNEEPFVEKLPDPEDVRLFDRVCDRFEAAWRAGKPPAIAEYLREIPERYRAELLGELLGLELEYRFQRGESPQRDDYGSRFPDHVDTIRGAFERWSTESTSCRRAASSETQRLDEQLLQTKQAQRAAEHTLPQLPGYEVTAVLGRGGMGVVYKARHVLLNRTVAVKMLTLGRNRPEDLARFRTEAEVAARLQHSNVAQIFEIGQHEGQPFLAFEYVSGGTLAEKMNRLPQPPVEAAKTMVTLARAVHAAHEQGILHRDLKPANVLVAGDGTLKVSDFGLAKKRDDDSTQTRTGEVLGTPSYMAPEQASGERRGIGPPTDIYSLGAVFYEMLTGRPPFQAATVWDTISQVIHDDPVPPTRLQSKTPADLETICAKCLQKDPRRRYHTAAVLADDIERFLADEPIHARPVGATERLMKWTRRNRGLAAAMGVIVMATVATIVTLSASNARIAASRREAVTAKERAETSESQAIVARKAAEESQSREEAAKNEALDLAGQRDKLARSERAQRLAVEKRTRIVETHRLAAQSRAALTDHPQRSLLLAVEAVEIARRAGEPVLPAARESLVYALSRTGGRPLRAPPVETVLRQMDPIWRKRVVQGAYFRPEDEGQRLRRIFHNRYLKQVTHQDAADDVFLKETRPSPVLNRVAVGPRGRWVAAAENTFTFYARPSSCTLPVVYAWDLTKGERDANPHVLVGPSSNIDDLAISGDGRWLAASAGETICLWRLGPDLKHAAKFRLSIASDFERRGMEEVKPDLGSAEGPWNESWAVAMDVPATVPSEPSSNPRTTDTEGSADEDSIDPSPVNVDKLMEDPDAASGGSETLLSASLEFSPNGEFLVAAWSSGRVRLWRMNEEGPVGAPIKLLSLGDRAYARFLVFSRNGRWLATARFVGRDDEDPSGGPAGAGRYDVFGRTVRLYDLSSLSGTVRPILVEPALESIESVALSDKGDRLAVGCSGTGIYVWPLHAAGTVGKPTVLKHPAGWANEELLDLSFLADGRWLASGTGGGARLWNLDSQTPIAPFPAFGCVLHVICDPNGRWLATVNNDASSINLYDPLALTAMSGTTHAVLGEVGELMIYGQNRQRRLYTESADGQSMPDAMALLGHEDAVRDVAVSHDGNWLVSASLDGDVRVWPTGRGEPLAVPTSLGRNNPIRDFTLMDEGRSLLTMETDLTPPDEVEYEERSIIRKWNLTSAENEVLPTKLIDVDEDLSLLAAPTNGRYVSSAGFTSARLWELPPGAPPKLLLKHPLPQYENKAYWEIPPQNLIEPSNLTLDPQGRWWALTLQPYGFIVQRVSEPGLWGPPVPFEQSDVAKIHFWRTDRGVPREEPALLAGHKNWITCLAASDNGDLIATASLDGTVRLWDTTAPDPARSAKVLKGHGGSVSKVAFAPSGKWLASGDNQGSVFVWNLADDLLKPTFTLKTDAGVVTALAFCPNDRWLVSGHWFDNVTQNHPRLWGLHAADPSTAVTVLHRHSQQDYCLLAKFSPDGRWLATVGDLDEPFVLWDMNAPEPGTVCFKPLRRKVPGSYVASKFGFSPDSRKLIAAGLDGLIRIWPLHIDDLLDLARRTAGRDFSEEERSQFLMLRTDEADAQRFRKDSRNGSQPPQDKRLPTPANDSD